MRLNFLLALMAFCLVNCDGQDTDDSVATVEQLTATVAYKQISGVDPNLLSLDIYYPNDLERAKPVVIYVHGGAWAIGDKSFNLQNKIDLFKRLGYVFISVNYRLSPSAATGLDPDRIKFPVHNQDVASAVAWTIENIADYGGDSSKIALMGHSAGAHLVALTGTNSRFLQAEGYSLDAIKGIAVVDTEGYDVRAKVLEGSAVYINAFGTDELENREASPLYNLTAGIDYPQFFIAKRGTSSRIATADRFIDALEATGIDHYEVEGSVYDHSGINNAIGAQDERLITDPLVAFFQRCFE